MSLLIDHRNDVYAEKDMQNSIIRALKKRRYVHSQNEDGLTRFREVKPIKIVDELRINEIGRISDIVVVFTERKIINIECKLNDVGGVIKQAIDHLMWCDYSYIALPHNTYIAIKYMRKCIDNNIGVLIYDGQENFIEAIKAPYNKKKDKTIRAKVNKQLGL